MSISGDTFKTLRESRMIAEATKLNRKKCIGKSPVNESATAAAIAAAKPIIKKAAVMIGTDLLKNSKVKCTDEGDGKFHVVANYRDELVEFDFTVDIKDMINKKVDKVRELLKPILEPELKSAKQLKVAKESQEPVVAYLDKLMALRSDYISLLQTTDCTGNVWFFNNKMRNAYHIADTETKCKLFDEWCESQAEMFFEFVEDTFSDELQNVLEFDRHHGSYFRFKESLGLITNHYIGWSDKMNLCKYLEDQCYIEDSDDLYGLKSVLADEQKLFDKLKQVIDYYNTLKSNQEASFMQFIRSQLLMTEAVIVKDNSIAKSLVKQEAEEQIVELAAVKLGVDPKDGMLDGLRKRIEEIADTACHKDIDRFDWQVDDITKKKVNAELIVDYADGTYSDSNFDFHKQLELHVTLEPKVESVEDDWDDVEPSFCWDKDAEASGINCKVIGRVGDTKIYETTNGELFYFDKSNRIDIDNILEAELVLGQ